MSSPPVIADLVARFHENRDAYVSGRYNEAQVRREFIDPFFKALGWDVWNEQGYAEAYKDLIHEDSLTIGGAHKAPDYCFRIGGTRKFFLETKKPSVDLKSDPAPAFQLRRYAWSAKLPLSILTDFEELAVYDCRVKPAATDKASAARIQFLTYTDYVPRWDEIASVFSRDAVLRGSFDRYAESTKKKAGTAEVDEAFLEEIEAWRDLLARNIALRNPALTQRQLNAAVQRTIDRIIFLRIAEDRGIEPYGRLQALLNGERVYRRLFELFERADERYNSGLFHFQPERGRPEPPDTLARALDMDDKPLKDILRALYYPESPYEFSVLPADILGQVYEQFLGKIIRLTPGHRAVVEDKPEVKKAGGVYYTPTYIVDYIVRHTLGPLLGESQSSSSSSSSSSSTPSSSPSSSSSCSSSSSTPSSSSPSEDKTRIEDEDEDEDEKTGTPQDQGTPARPRREITPKQVARLRILDPACGSGSFLLGAYQYLLDWHLRYYTAHDPQKWATGRHPALFEAGPSRQSAGSSRQESQAAVGTTPLAVANRQSEIGNRQSTWRLTTAERKRILLDNLYGVDIDPQAVEVTKLSLLLKVLEGESGETLRRQFDLFHERALPDLAANIKCGNSLIAPDFYRTQQGTLFDEEETFRINAFDWAAEFPEIMSAGGFDAVIGNPPYVRQESLAEFKSYLKARYKAYHSMADLYVYFMEKGVSLLRADGFFGIIVSSSFLRTTYAVPLRGLLKQQCAVMEIVDFGGLRIFEKAQDIYVCIPILSKRPQPQDVQVTNVISSERHALTPLGEHNQHPVPATRLTSAGWPLDRQARTQVWSRILASGTPLIGFVNSRIFMGIKTGLNQAFEIDRVRRDAFVKDAPNSAALIKPFLGGQDIRRYHLRESGRFLITIPCGWTTTQLAAATGKLGRFSERDAWDWLTAVHPSIAEHLAAFASPAKRRQDQGEFWWELRACDYYDAMDSPKIIYPDIAKNPRFCLDTTGAYVGNTAYCLGTADRYLLGVLNSRLSWFAVSCLSIPFGTRAGQFRYRLIYQYMEKFPIRTIDLGNPAEAAARDRIVDLVEGMLLLHKRLPASQTDQEQVAIRRQVDATDREIDELVYRLYGLTADEIKIVEEATGT